MRRTFTAAALGAALLGSLVQVPARAAIPVSVDAIFTSSQVAISCTSTGCTISATSNQCVAGGIKGNGVPYSGECVAKMTIRTRWYRYPTPPGYPQAPKVCYVASGTFSFSNDLGTKAVTSAGAYWIEKGATTWTTPRFLSIGADTYAGAGNGTISATCSDPESVRDVFNGQYHYVMTATPTAS